MKVRPVLYLLSLVLMIALSVEGRTNFNVLFIAVDDLRPELGCYGGSPVKSPNIDRLAAQSLQFNRAYCQFALCNPSRASLLSGRRPETIKVYDLGTFVRKHDPNLITLPQLFKQHGYETMSIGKIFHTGHGNKDDAASWSRRPKPLKVTEAPKPNREKPEKPAKAADDHSDTLPTAAPDVDDASLPDGIIALQAVEALKDLKGKPFFLAVGFHKPHLPFIAPKKYWDLYDPAAIQLATNQSLPKDAPEFASNDASEIRRYKNVPAKGALSEPLQCQLIHGYYASVSYVDAQIGKVLAELDRSGLRENTIVILWGDHGYQLGEHGTWNKRTNWEIATRVPLLISTPSQNSAGKKSDALVEFVDIYPTLAELCALPLPSGLEGTSFVPLIHDEKLPWKAAAFSTYTKSTELGNTFGRAMRTDQYRFVEWRADGNDKRAYELYDHVTDPQENTNIANLPKNRELVSALTKQLEAGWSNAVPKYRMIKN